MSVGYILVTTYVSVLVAELVGDKMVYTVAALCARFKTKYVLAGVGLACCGKTLAAVTFGRLITQLPHPLVGAVSTLTFFVTAICVWRRNAHGPAPPIVASASRSNAFVVSFAAIFFSEWADVGQLTTAVLAARFQVPLLIWMGATLALMTKALGAAAIGVKLRTWVPSAMLRVAIASWFIVLGAISLLTTLVSGAPRP